MSAQPVTVVDHPLVQHKLTLMRKTDTATSKFRLLLKEIAHLLAYEVLRDLDVETVEIETPLETMMEDIWRWQSGNPDGYAGR